MQGHEAAGRQREQRAQRCGRGGEHLPQRHAGQRGQQHHLQAGGRKAGTDLMALELCATQASKSEHKESTMMFP